MKLFESINSPKGITLNNQLIDLLSIIDDDQLSVQEQNLKINEYIENLRAKKEKKEQFVELYEQEGFPRFLLDDFLSKIELSDEDRGKIKDIYLSAFKDLSIIDTDRMKQVLNQNGCDEYIAEYILHEIKDNDYFIKARYT